MTTEPKVKHYLKPSQWSSTIGFVLATSGAAVGLGNIWMFPYVTGMNGGGAFVLVYLACVLLIGLPVMMAEAMIGRHGRQNPINCIEAIAKASHVSPRWKYIGVWGGFALILVLSFYSVVSGWSIAYGFKAITGTFDGATTEGIQAQWKTLMASPGLLLLYHTIFMMMTMGVVAFGVEKGLERASKIMMPGLILILLFLVIYAMVTGEFMRSVHFLFNPDFSKLTLQSILTAMGLSFFTLALGAGCIVTYASYLPEKTKLTHSLCQVVALDVGVALLAGLAIFPLVFAYGLTPTAGPGLVFEVLPMAFSKIVGGHIIGCLFFFLLLFAAWTSSISLAEPLVVMIYEKSPLTRHQAVALVGVVAWVIGIGVLLSFNKWESIKFMGQYTFFDMAVNIPNKIILPTGGLLFAIFAGYRVNKAIAQKDLVLKNNHVFALWRFLVRYVSPLAIIIVLIGQFI